MYKSYSVLIPTLIFLFLIFVGQTYIFAADSLPAKPLLTRKMKLLLADCFIMGSEEYSAEEPPHKVCLNAFYLDQYEVMLLEYNRVLGTGSVSSVEAKLPAVSMTWADADNYCRKLGLRLPSEAEWEYAARAKKNSSYHW